MEKNEKKYDNLINDLKNLQQVKAPANFEPDLKRRINEEKYKTGQKSFWSRVFVPSRLVPSLGLATAAIVVFLVININSEEMDNPFLIEPRLREDIVAVKDWDSFQDENVQIKKEKSAVRRDIITEELKGSEKPEITDNDFFRDGKEESETDAAPEQPLVVTEGEVAELEITPPESTLAGLTDEVEPTETTSEIAAGLAITEKELNFRQVQLSEEEQQVVNELRTKVQSLQNIEVKEEIKQER